MDKMHKVMSEFKHGELRSGSKTGPKVGKRAQAIAIALSEARKAGQKVPKKRGFAKLRGRGTKMAGMAHDMPEE